MKFFHLSDLHIGIRLYNRDLREDQEFVFGQIIRLAGEREPDAVVIAGDIYDRAVPSAEAVALFDAFVTDLRATVPEAVIMMISGNHDSAARINCFRSVLGGQGIYMIGIPPRSREEHIERVTLKDEYGPVNFYLLPFVRPSMYETAPGEGISYNETLHRIIEGEMINTLERNVLVSHQFYLPVGAAAESIERSDSEIRTVGNIDEVRSDVLAPFDYAALGHIHKSMSAGNKAYCYCGTPLAYSVSEAGQVKGLMEVELKEKGNISIRKIRLEPVHEVRVVRGTLEEVLGQVPEQVLGQVPGRTTEQGLRQVPGRMPGQGMGQVSGQMPGQAVSEDYVSIVLTDKVDLEVCDMQDRLRAAYPNYLEIRREVRRGAAYGRGIAADSSLGCMSGSIDGSPWSLPWNVDGNPGSMLEGVDGVVGPGGGDVVKKPDPYELCCSFLGETDEEERSILRDVIRYVQEAEI